jgi:hypothetical protein
MFLRTKLTRLLDRNNKIYKDLWGLCVFCYTEPMIRHSSLQKGSTQVVIIIILVTLLLGVFGFILWQNVIANKQDTISNTETNNASNENANEEVTVETGTIVGSLTYPAEAIPTDMEVHAVNLDTGKEYTTNEHLEGNAYQYGIGYRIEVPAGRYNVYGTLAAWPGTKAYYNQVIVCGIKVECTDTTKIEVIVEANKDTADATVGDWWTIE